MLQCVLTQPLPFVQVPLGWTGRLEGTCVEKPFWLDFASPRWPGKCCHFYLKVFLCSLSITEKLYLEPAKHQTFVKSFVFIT